MKNQGTGGASELDLHDRTSRRALTLRRAVRPDSSAPSSAPGLTPGRPPPKPAPTSPLTAIPGCPRNGSAVGRQTMPCCSGQSQRPLLRRRAAPAEKTRSAFAGERWSPAKLGLPWVLQVWCAHRNMGRPQQTQKLEQVSILDAVGPSFFPSSCRLV